MLLKYAREQAANIMGGKECLLATVEEGKVMALCYIYMYILVNIVMSMY